MHIRVHIYMYTHCTWVPHIVCIYHYCWWPPLFLQHLPVAWHKKIHHLLDRALIHIVQCIGGPRDIPQSCICISVSATKTCSDNWLYNAHTLYIHVHTLYIHVHTVYKGTTYILLVQLGYFSQQTSLYHLHVIQCIYIKYTCIYAVHTLYIQCIYMYMSST